MFLRPYIVSSIVCVTSVGTGCCDDQAVGNDAVENAECLTQPLELIHIGGGPVRLFSYHPTETSFSGETHFDVNVSSFAIGKYEVTAAQYNSFSDAISVDVDESTPLNKRLSQHIEFGSPYAAEIGGTDERRYPATGMNQWAAKRFCMWLSVHSGRFYRLPTEAEWELACGGPKGSEYPWGDDFSKAKEFARVGHGEKFPAQIGKRRPNKFGIYDMIGNAEEWVADGFRDRQSKNFGKADHGGRRNLNDAIQWPVREFVAVYPDRGKRLMEAMLRSNQIPASGMPVTKGGSGLAVGGPTRCVASHAFRTSARTEPENYDRSRPEPYVFAGPAMLPESLQHVIGFRVTRPEQIPSRQIQLWHWGIYYDYDKWLNLTLPPTEEN